MILLDQIMLVFGTETILCAHNRIFSRFLERAQALSSWSNLYLVQKKTIVAQSHEKKQLRLLISQVYCSGLDAFISLAATCKEHLSIFSNNAGFRSFCKILVSSTSLGYTFSRENQTLRHDWLHFLSYGTQRSSRQVNEMFGSASRLIAWHHWKTSPVSHASNLQNWLSAQSLSSQFWV